MRKGDPRLFSSFGHESDFTPVPLQHPQDESVSWCARVWKHKPNEDSGIQSFT
ncbi:hypothetical protein LINGRAHAP2_LOCUS23575 [Linum grandiflorum]